MFYVINKDEVTVTPFPLLATAYAHIAAEMEVGDTPFSAFLLFDEANASFIVLTVSG